MAIVRLYTGEDGKSHFEDIEPVFEPLDDSSERAIIRTGSGVEIMIRRFDPKRSNPWHPAPGKVCVFTISGSVDIEVGDGSTRRIGPGDILIAEDVTGEGHYTRESGSEPRVSIFVPLTK